MLRLEDVHSYYGDSHVVQGVSLTVERGETVALVGRNGAGKTTLLKTIMGIVPARRGRVLLDALTSRACPRTRSPGGASPSSPRIAASSPGSRWRRTCAWPSSRTGAGGDGARGRVFEYFPRLGERLDQAGQNLSGGEQQMLALARGFLTRPALMLIDELSGGLMPMLVDALMDILRRINADGVTILLVEQELDVALALASRCYVLDQGRIQFEGASESLRADHDVQARFLGAT